MDSMSFYFLVFSSRSFLGKDAREVNSLSSCISKNAFILLSCDYAMDNIEVEHFFRVLEALFCYLLKPSVSVEKSGAILIICFVYDWFFPFLWKFSGYFLYP